MLGTDRLLTVVIKEYLQILKDIEITRQIRKPKRQDCGFGIHDPCDTDINYDGNNYEPSPYKE